MKKSELNKKNHYDLWMWLSEHPESWKDEWPGWKTLKINRFSLPKYFCFLCREFHSRKKIQPCNGCPLSNGVPKGCELSGPFKEWQYGFDRQKNAEIIANCWK